jgi:uncharacterized protein (DUF488 family)
MLKMPEADFEHHYRNILAGLDPQVVFDELGADSILLCWEKFNECCHRRMVAEWLESRLSIEITEYEHDRKECIDFAEASRLFIAKQQSES